MKAYFRRLLALKFRTKRRYKAKTGLYIVPESQLGRNQVGDISLGGLSYYYIDNGMRPKKSDYSVTLLDREKKDVVQVYCRTVSDDDAGELVYQKRRIKRRSVRFVGLSFQQKQQIKRLIKAYTYGDSRIPILNKG